MYLTTLKLFNFRNYGKEELSFGPGINIFNGLNAQGKTNLLEAIYYLAVSRSFRTSRESDLLRFGSERFKLEGCFKKKERRFQVGINYQIPGRLQIKLNGKAIKRADYISRLPVVVFSPEDLLLVKEGPSRRRRFLDTEGSRLKPLYYHRLRDYYRVLRQRNRVLKENRGNRFFDRSLLAPWDEALIKHGSTIVKERIKMLRALEELAGIHFAALTAKKESLTLRYLSTVDFKHNFDLLEGSFREQLEESFAAEIRRGSTIAGPHLDDFAIMINGYDARKYGSQGQQRSVVLALKIGEVDLFKKAGGGETILLLDDVLSEFDAKRSSHLLQFLSEREGQSFITTAAPHCAAGHRWPGRPAIYTVYRGKIRID